MTVRSGKGGKSMEIRKTFAKVALGVSTGLCAIFAMFMLLALPMGIVHLIGGEVLFALLCISIRMVIPFGLFVMWK